MEIVAEGERLDGLAAALRGSPDFSLVKITPAHLDALRDLVPPEEAAGATRAFVIGGEALAHEALEFWREHAPLTRLVNEYGPTETVVGCAVYDAAPDAGARGPVPIGRPIANTRLYVLGHGARSGADRIAGRALHRRRRRRARVSGPARSHRANASSPIRSRPSLERGCTAAATSRAGAPTASSNSSAAPTTR